MPRLDRLEQGGAQRRRQHQRHHHRQADGGDDGHRELAIDHAGGAAEEGQRQEHRHQHHADADEGAGDLLHRLAGRLLGGQPLLLHDALHVLDHHDGVVDEEPDRQHEGEEGEGVDRIAEGRQDAEGAQEHHRHRDRRDQRGAPVLQEDVHHHEDQHDGLQERLHDVLDGDLDEGRGVDRIDVADVGRELRRQARHRLLDGVHGRQRIGARRQLDGEARAGMAVVAAVEAVAVLPELDPRHVADCDGRAVALGLQDDLPELLGRLQASLGDDHRIQLLVVRRRRVAKLAGGHLGVLRLDRRAHVGRHQAVGLQLVGVEPDAHRVLAAEDLGVAHARQAADRVLQLGGDVVAEVGGVVGPVLGIEAHHDQEVAPRLGHHQALLLHLLRQVGGGELQFVLHLHLGDVGVRALLEGQGDGDVALAVAGRGEVLQVVQPLHLLLDHLGDHGLEGLSRGPG